MVTSISSNTQKRTLAHILSRRVLNKSAFQDLKIYFINLALMIRIQHSPMFLEGQKMKI